MQLSDTQIADLGRMARPWDQDNPTYTYAQLIQDILDGQEDSTVGITANALDVNAIASPGVAARWDPATTPGNTLNFAWKSFRLAKPGGYATVAAGSIALAASTPANYIEVDPASLVVSTNTGGFTANRLPLFVVNTGASSYTPGNITSVLAVPFAIGVGSLSGVLLSTPAKTKHERIHIGTIPTAAGTIELLLPVPTTIGAATITKVRLVAKDGLATDNTNYASIGVINLGNAGAGTTAVVDITAAANTTKTTGGSAIVAYTPRDLTIASNAVNGGDVLKVSITGSGTLANTVNEAAMLFEMSFVN